MKKGIFIFFMSAAMLQLQAQTSQFDSVNSMADEMNPVIAEGGEALYFTRVFHEQNTGGMRDPGDIWYSQMTDSLMWSPPVNLPAPLNNNQYNGVIGFSQDGNTMYLYEHYMPGGVAAKTQGISTSVKRNGEWTTPARLDIKYFYNRSEHISINLSADGTIMLLSLESYGTLGAEDLYVSMKTGNEWSEPKNLGPMVNTELQEMTPYIAPDNKTIFFASNGYDGYGGRDIYVTTRLDDSWRNWSEPKNLGPKVNTEGVELHFQYFLDDEHGIYTSTQNSDGYSDLKYVHLPKSELEELIEDTISTVEPEITIVENEEEIESLDQVAAPNLKITGLVLNEVDDNPIAAELVVKGDNWQQVFRSVPEGGFEIALPTHDVYEVTVTADGFVSIQEVVDIRTTEMATISHDFVLQPIAVGTTVKLNNVLFVRGSTELLESSYSELDLVIEMMKENPEMEISLAGHTDNQGNARLNQVLSQQRVDAVMAYLKSNGIETQRLSGKGYGGTQPIASNDSEETRRLNRRVEFTIEKY